MIDKPSSAQVTTTDSSPPIPTATSTKVSLPEINWVWRRWFCIVAAGANAILWFFAQHYGRETWSNCVVFCVIVFVYVVGATSTEIVQLVQSSGIIKAAQAATGAVTTVAEVIETKVGYKEAP